MLLIAAVVVLLTVAVVAILAALQPREIAVERSMVIRASLATVFGSFNDFAQWPKWAPQDREDPSLKRTNSSPSTGTGATSDWIGSGSSGAGRMTITQSITGELVRVQVDFQRPFVARNVNEFRFAPVENGTRVTWSMRGPNVPLLRVMSVFTSVDKLMGKHFETGLANLAATVENPR